MKKSLYFTENATKKNEITSTAILIAVVLLILFGIFQGGSFLLKYSEDYEIIEQAQKLFLQQKAVAVDIKNLGLADDARPKYNGGYIYRIKAKKYTDPSGKTYSNAILWVELNEYDASYRDEFIKCENCY